MFARDNHSKHSEQQGDEEKSFITLLTGERENDGRSGWILGPRCVSFYILFFKITFFSEIGHFSTVCISTE